MKRFDRLVALVVLAGIVGGCGSSGEPAERVREQSVVEAAPPLEEVVVKDVDVRRGAAGSPARAFLEFWRKLQYQAFVDAILTYDPGLVEAIGADRLVEALESQAPYFRSVKPRVTRTLHRTGERNEATVYYEVKDVDGAVTGRSIRWQRQGGSWRIVYDPFLDTALRSSVQSIAQADIDPTARTPSKRAIQAGLAAARLQSAYLAERLEDERLARRSTPSPTATPSPTP